METNRMKMAVKMRIKYVLEFSVEASVTELYEKISTEYGLEKWFANKVALIDDETYLFEWDEISVHAKVSDIKKNSFIRFKILENSDSEYLELRILRNEVTDDISLEITDFANEDEVEDYKMLFRNQVSDLKHLIRQANLV